MNQFWPQFVFFTFALFVSHPSRALPKHGPSAKGNVSASQSCAREGETIGTHAGSKLCCEGLIPSNSWLHQNHPQLGCKAPVPPGSSETCIRCGDAKCDEPRFENKCICPRDCRL